jgi:phage-related protein
MAVVGSAYIVVRAITTGFTKDVQKQFGGIGNIGNQAGSTLGKNFSRSFAKVGKLDMSGISDQAMAARERFTELIRSGYKLSAAIGVVVPALGALAGGLVSVVGSLVAATPAAITLAGGFVALGLAAITAKLALSGVGAAVSKLNKQAAGGGNEKAAQRRIDDALQALKDTIRRNKEALREADKVLADSTNDLTEAQLELNKALAEGQEELQQLNFDSEDAALAEKKAALELEKARETLLRVQDLPPNSRARKEAELAFAEADLNLRRAKDRNSDLAKEQERLAKEGVEGTEPVIAARERIADAEKRVAEATTEKANAVVNAAEAQKRADTELARAKEDAASGGAAGGDPLEGLTESQKTFAKFIASLKPKIDELKEAVAAAFLPDLQKASDQIVNGTAFDVIKDGLAGIGDALGDASLSLSDAITDAANLANLDAVFKTSESVIRSLGGALGSAYGAALSALAIADPQIRGFFDFLEGKAGQLDAWLKTEDGKKEFERIIKEAESIAKDSFKIIGDTISGLFNLGTSGAGQPLLDYFKQVAADFKAFTSTDAGVKLFTDLSTNAAKVLDAVGGFVKEIVKIGARPEVGIVAEKFAEMAPTVGLILTELVKASPAIADFAGAFLELIATFTQGEQITTFFNVLTGAIEFVNGIFQNEFVKGILDAVAPIVGALTAVGVIFDVVKFGLLVIAGQILLTKVAFMAAKFIFSSVFNVLRTLGGVFLNIARTVIPLVINGMRLLGAAFMANPIGFLIGIIAILVTAFITAYATSEDFRNKVNAAFQAVSDFVKPIIDAILGAVTGVFNWVRDNWPLLLAIITGPFGLAIKFIYDNWDGILAFIKGIPEKIGGFLKNAWDSITTGVKTAWTNTTNFFTTIFNTIKGLPGQFGGFLKGLWDGLLSGLKGVWQSVKDFWNSTIGGKGFSIDIPGWVPVFGGKKYDIRIPRLAQGGVAMPVPGGILANIAEGGRPERIEPLDPDGLSKRDKAIISELSGGAGGKGMTFNIYPSAGMDERELADMISRKISFMMRKGAAA